MRHGDWWRLDHGLGVPHLRIRWTWVVLGRDEAGAMRARKSSWVFYGWVLHSSENRLVFRSG